MSRPVRTEAELTAEFTEALADLRSALATASLDVKRVVAFAIAVDLGRDAGFRLRECVTRLAVPIFNALNS